MVTTATRQVTYRGRHHHDGRLVTVSDGVSEGPLRHHIKHSPDGFSWGYSGSGPAELARCILWDHLGAEPHPMAYQAFKEHYVAMWSPVKPWTITTAEMEGWCRSWASASPDHTLLVL